MTIDDPERRPCVGPYHWGWIRRVPDGLRQVRIADFHDQTVALIGLHDDGMTPAESERRAHDCERTAEAVVAAWGAGTCVTAPATAVDLGPFPKLGDDQEQNFTVRCTAVLGVSGRVRDEDHLRTILARLFVLHPPIDDAHEDARDDEETTSALESLGHDLEIVAVGPVESSHLPPADKDMATVDFLLKPDAAGRFANTLRAFVADSAATVATIPPVTERKLQGEPRPAIVRLRWRLRPGESPPAETEVDMT